MLTEQVVHETMAAALAERGIAVSGEQPSGVPLPNHVAKPDTVTVHDGPLMGVDEKSQNIVNDAMSAPADPSQYRLFPSGAVKEQADVADAAGLFHDAGLPASLANHYYKAFAAAPAERTEAEMQHHAGVLESQL